MKLNNAFRLSLLLMLSLMLLVSAGSTVAQDKQTVTIWWPQSTSGEMSQCLMETSTPLFNEQSADYEIQWIIQPPHDDYRNIIRTAVVAGSGPDVVTTDGAAFTFELASAGLLLPLDEYIEQYSWDELIADWALGLVQVEGQRYGIPAELESVILYYNATLFEEKGWTPPATIDEMIAVAEAAQAEGIIPFAHAYSECVPCNEWIIGQFLNHWAGPQKVYEALTGQREWTDPDFVEAMQMLGEMPGKGWFMGSLENFFSLTFDDMHAAIGNGEAAMNIEGTWHLGTVDLWFGEDAGNENDWGWVPMPTRSGAELWDIGTGGMWSISGSSQVPDGAAEFINFWYQPEQQVLWLNECGFQLSPVEVSADAFANLDPRVAEIYSSLTAASANNDIGYTPWTFFPSKTDVYIYTEIQRLYDGQITAEEFLEGMQTQFAEEFAAGEVPPIPITNGSN
jgi:raffinose/stachyose/melibiose transport system substrate-binding protein